MPFSSGLSLPSLHHQSRCFWMLFVRLLRVLLFLLPTLLCFCVTYFCHCFWQCWFSLISWSKSLLYWICFCSFGFLFGVSSCLPASSRVSRAVCEYFLDECVRILCWYCQRLLFVAMAINSDAPIIQINSFGMFIMLHLSIN